MAKTYWLDNSAGRSLARVDPTDASDSVSVSSGGSIVAASYIEPLPNSDLILRTSTGAFAVEVNITTAASSTQMRARLERRDTTGLSVLASENSAFQSTATTGLKTFNFSNPALGTWDSTDRLQVVLEVQNNNAHGGAVTVAWDTGTADSEVSTPFSDPINVDVAESGSATDSISGVVFTPINVDVAESATAADEVASGSIHDVAFLDGFFPAVVGTQGTVSDFNTSHSFDVPAQVRAGDLLLAYIAIRNAPSSVVTPTGWTKLGAVGEGNANGPALTLLAKIAAGNEGTVPFTISASGWTATVVQQIAGWRGDLTLDSIDFAFFDSGTFGGAANPPALNPTNWDVESTLWIAVGAVSDGSGDITAGPTDYVQFVASPTIVAPIQVAAAIKRSASASADPSAFTKDSAWAVAATIAVRPASSTIEPDNVTDNVSATSATGHAVSQIPLSFDVYEQNASDTAVAWVFLDGTITAVGQKFTSPYTGVLAGCNVAYSYFGSTTPGDPVFVKVYRAGEDGLPVGSAIAVSDSIPADDDGLVQFLFNENNRTVLRTGLDYVVTIEFPTSNATNRIQVQAGELNQIPTSVMLQRSAAGVWSERPDPDHDLRAQLFVTIDTLGDEVVAEVFRVVAESVSAVDEQDAEVLRLVNESVSAADATSAVLNVSEAVDETVSATDAASAVRSVVGDISETTNIIPVAPSLFSTPGLGGGLGSVSMSWAKSVGDFGLMLIETAGEEVVIDNAGWTKFLDTGDMVFGPSATRLQGWWKRATNSTSETVTAPDPGNHWVGVIQNYRGVKLSGNPIEALATGYQTGTSFPAPTISVSRAKRLVLVVASRSEDSSGQFFNTFTNPGLTFTELRDFGGNGGGISINSAEPTVAGSIGTTTVTAEASINSALATFSLIPELDVVIPDEVSGGVLHDVSLSESVAVLAEIYDIATSDDTFTLIESNYAATVFVGNGEVLKSVTFKLSKEPGTVGNLVVQVLQAFGSPGNAFPSGSPMASVNVPISSLSEASSFVTVDFLAEGVELVLADGQGYAIECFISGGGAPSVFVHTQSGTISGVNFYDSDSGSNGLKNATGSVVTQVSATDIADGDIVVHAADVSELAAEVIVLDSFQTLGGSINIRSTSFKSAGQVFRLSSAGRLDLARFVLSATIAPSNGVLQAHLYATTGTFGLNAKPTGSPLASSDTLDATTITGSPTWYDFVFDGSFDLAPNVAYAIVVTTTSTNTVALGANSNGHAGNLVNQNSVGTWGSDSFNDVNFQVATALIGAIDTVDAEVGDNESLISESASASETQDVEIDFNASQSESVSANDASSASAALSVAVAETTTAAEEATGVSEVSADIAEATSASDAQDFDGSSNLAVSESAAADATQDGALVTESAVSESNSAQDAQDVEIDFNASQSETANAVDSANADTAIADSVSEGVSADDTSTVVLHAASSANEAASAADAQTVQSDQVASAEESVSATETSVVQNDAVASASESASAVDAYVRIANQVASQSETAAAVDETDAETTGNFNATRTEAANATDSQDATVLTMVSPVADVSVGAWEPSTGANLFPMIDEIVADDGDYIFTRASSVAEVSLAPVDDPQTSEGYTVAYRAKGNGTTDLIVRLKQGSTIIAQWTETNVPNVETDFTHDLTGAEADAITDHSDLRIELEAVA